MKKFFYSLIAFSLLFGGAPAFANGSRGKFNELCHLYKHAHARKLHPTNKPLVCVNFTLPSAGANVSLRVTRGTSTVIKDAKFVATREGRFCYPRSRWLRADGPPDKVFLCSEHSVTLKDGQIPQILSTRGTRPAAYACLRGMPGCGDINNVAIPADQLGR